MSGSRLASLVTLLACGCSGGSPAAQSTQPEPEASWADAAIAGSAAPAGGSHAVPVASRADSAIGSNSALCDGSPGIAFSVALFSGGLVDAVTLFGETNGVVFLYVSGTCEYWVNDANWFTVHGALDARAEARVAKALGFEGLAAAAGSWPAQDGCFDQPLLRLEARGAEVECWCDCPTAPAVVRDAHEAFSALVDQLVAQGEPWQGPMRALVLESSTDLSSCRTA